MLHEPQSVTDPFACVQVSNFMSVFSDLYLPIFALLLSNTGLCYA